MTVAMGEVTDPNAALEQEKTIANKILARL